MVGVLEDDIGFQCNFREFQVGFKIQVIHNKKLNLRPSYEAKYTWGLLFCVVLAKFYANSICQSLYTPAPVAFNIGSPAVMRAL